jgi:hypothetical protein
MAVTRYMRASNSSSTKQTLLARPGSARRFSARRRAKRFVFCCETTFRHAWIFFALTATEENRKAAPARSQADQAELWKIATAAAQAGHLRPRPSLLIRDGRQCGRTVGDFTLVGSAAGDDCDHNCHRSRSSSTWLDYDKPGKHAPSASPVGKESLAACRTYRARGRFCWKAHHARKFSHPTCRSIATSDGLLAGRFSVAGFLRSPDVANMRSLPNTTSD